MVHWQPVWNNPTTPNTSRFFDCLFVMMGTKISHQAWYMQYIIKTEKAVQRPRRSIYTKQIKIWKWTFFQNGIKTTTLCTNKATLLFFLNKWKVLCSNLSSKRWILLLFFWCYFFVDTEITQISVGARFTELSDHSSAKKALMCLLTRSGRSIWTQWLAPSTYLMETLPLHTSLEILASDASSAASLSPQMMSVGMVMPPFPVPSSFFRSRDMFSRENAAR